jgi:nucleoside-diphosphate-sugar epimerase
MMDVENSLMYQEDIKQIAELGLPWEMLRNKNIVISGATGQIGKFFVDVIHYKNIHDLLHCTVFALGRDRQKAEARLGKEIEMGDTVFCPCDISKEIICSADQADYVFHFASETHPSAYASNPIGTIAANVIGTNNLLQYASRHDCRRFLFASSVEIYGENRGDTEKFDESYCGYIDSNTLRAGYPESKRTGEALCQAYGRSEGLGFVIPRLPRTFGPTLLCEDDKAISQFIHKAVRKENIVLKSAGMQYYSYAYTADAVSAILYCLFKGENGQAYNAASDACNLSLKDLASLCAEEAGTHVVFDCPAEQEKLGYSAATKAVMDSTKLETLGWQAHTSMKQGIERTIRILQEKG